MEPKKFSLRRRVKSFQYAFQGLQQFFSSTHNAIIHAVATAAVFALAHFVQLPLSKLLFIVGAAGLVWMAELFNTAIERLCDILCPDENPQIKFIKDLSAAAVLVTALVALTTFLLIFIPLLYDKK